MNTKILQQLLLEIPQSNQEAQSIDDIAHRIGITADEVRGAVMMLQLLGVVIFDDDIETVQATSQTGKYMLNSLANFTTLGMPIVTDWKTRGVIADQPLHNGASLLWHLENARLSHRDEVQASRFERVGQVIITRQLEGTDEPEYLFQFDKNAQQYQLIGGRWRESDGEDLLYTIVREIEEEIPNSDMRYEVTYQLDCVIEKLIPPLTLSPTFGALTHYEFAIYHMHTLSTELNLSDDDLWIPLSQVLSGDVIGKDGKVYPFQSTTIYDLINEQLPQGWAGLQSSFVKSV